MDLDHPLVSSAIFHPRDDYNPDPFLVRAGGLTLACRYLNEHPGAGTVLYFHGNGETVTLCADYLGDLFLGLGVNVCFVEYRGYGGSDGTPALTAMLGDGEAVLDVLGLPDGRVAAFGRSIGSLYAAELASRRPGLGGLILESGIADLGGTLLRRVLGPAAGMVESILGPAVKRSFDQEAKLARYPGPVLVLHTKDDGLLDADHAERLHAWAGGADKELVIFDRGDHNSIYHVNERAYRAHLGAFLSRIGLRAGGPVG